MIDFIHVYNRFKLTNTQWRKDTIYVPETSLEDNARRIFQDQPLAFLAVPKGQRRKRVTKPVYIEYQDIKAKEKSGHIYVHWTIDRLQYEEGMFAR